ncbi:MAG: threonine ammonia-lyase [Oscillospiraceae bacterium]|nr:threonine ammonia-lyase [Oscillospiraceae bacterium]MDD6502015.1 threonine ammonia-lyase [Oscillospiraceae bacterium]
MLTLGMVYEAQKRLKDVARVTPLNPAPTIGENVYIKAENLQLTGSFKLRGAFNKISSLTDEEKSKGVIACSAGNHAQGVALSATKNGIKSVICMPAGAPIAKVEATKGYGAEVVLVDGVYDDAAREAERLTQEHGYTFAHPFNDEYVMAGQGTIALEIIQQLPEVEQIVVPIGGGGLISGVAFTIKQLKPECKVIGVQAATVPSMYESVKNGQITTVKDGNTIADGIHVLTPGNLTFEMVQKYVDEVVTVTEDEICAAILTLMESQKTVAEGAGATPVAACLYGKVDMSKKTVCVVSGGNVDVTTLSRILTKGLAKTGRIVELKTKVVDKPGQLTHLLQIIADTGANIMSVDHKREDKEAEVNVCVVSMVLETRNPAHVEQIRTALKAAGYELLDA